MKHCAKEAPYTIDADFFQKMDWTIEQCLKNNLAVSIDQHYYPAINMGEDDPDLTWEQNLDRIKSLWTQIAEHYKDYPNDMLFFDLLNEPNMRLGADGLNKLHAELIAIIRRTNPGRTLIIALPIWDRPGHWRTKIPGKRMEYHRSGSLLPASYLHPSESGVCAECDGRTSGRVARNRK